MLYPGSAADPGAVMQIVPGAIDYLDKKKRESYYEEVKTFKTNLDVVREWVDSDAKCNTLGRSGSPRKDRIFPPSPPPSAAIRRCEGGSEERKIE
jgi:hypothetical protein